jgi:AraC-like DNA-binding protein
VQPTLVEPGMRYWRIAPDARLREIVRCYWIVEGEQPSSLLKSVDDEVALMIPDGHSEIVFNRGGTGFERWHVATPAKREFMRGSYLIGGRSHSVATSNRDRVRFAGVKLDSRFLRALIGTPLSEFRDTCLPLRDLGAPLLLELEERVALAESPEPFTRLLDEFFLDGLRRRGETSATDALLHSIHRDRGTTSIMRWASDAGVDARSLERRFCAATGMTPKQYARVIRFKHAYHSLVARRTREPLTNALDGFYDQSHFNREFRFFTGMAPGERLSGSARGSTTIADHLLWEELSA